MSLPVSLQGSLIQIARDLTRGTLGESRDYLTHYHAEVLSGSEQNTSDEVLAFLDSAVRRRTDGQRSVVFADRRYFAEVLYDGLLFAMVPTGDDTSSSQATYFGIAAARGGVSPPNERRSTVKNSPGLTGKEKSILGVLQLYLMWD